MKKILKTMLQLTAAACLIWIAYFFGTIDSSMDEPYRDEHAKALYALQKTGITADFVPEFVVHGSHIGRKHFIQTVFTVSYADRERLLETMRPTEGWHIEHISVSDYRGFADVVWYPEMTKSMIADDVGFDAWYYRTTKPSAGWEEIPAGHFGSLGRVGRGFVFAVYDAETGLFVFIDQFG